MPPSGKTAPAAFLHHLDSHARFGRVLQVVGWSELADPAAGFSVDSWGNGMIVRGDVRPVERPDLADFYEEWARWWGFEALLVFPTAEAARAACAGPLVLTSAKGQVVIERPAEAFGNLLDRDSAELESRFFDSVRSLQPARVLEVGSRARSNVSRRDLFSGCEYVGIDIVAGENVDVVADVHQLSKYRVGRFDFVFSVSVFEHLLMPWKAAIELAKVMNEGGLAFIQTHQAWPIHDAPWDFWRFSREAWDAIFNRYTGFEIVGTAYKVPCYYISQFDDGNPVTDFGFQTGYYGVVCLARKIGPPLLDWSVIPAEITGTRYPR